MKKLFKTKILFMPLWFLLIVGVLLFLFFPKIKLWWETKAKTSTWFASLNTKLEEIKAKLGIQNTTAV
jgi:hypothetical protein